jgi:uncharacterized protein (DUF1800 family)
MQTKSISRRTFLKISGSLGALSTISPSRSFSQTSQTPSPKTAPSTSPKASIKVPLETLALNRLTFGARKKDIENFRKLGKTPQAQLHAYVEKQLQFKDGSKTFGDKICDDLLASAQLPTLKKSLRELWAEHVVAADKIRDEEKTMTASPDSPPKDPNKLRMQPMEDVNRATWIRAVYSEHQLFEKMVNFWHDHFSVFGWDQKIAPVFMHYDRDVIRKNAFGNFRELLEAVAKSPAMLFYLDNAINQSGNPNENFARELFELHTLGAENYLGTKDRTLVSGFAKGAPVGYVDGDVYEAARAFTGWRVEQGNNTRNTGEFEYFDQWHDRFQKVVLGRHLGEYQPPLKDGHDVLDLVAYHPGTAHFIARKICRRFISDNPPESIVKKTADTFLKNKKDPHQIQQVLRTVFYSPEFANSWGQKSRRPFETITAFLRMTDAKIDGKFDPSDRFVHLYENTGHKLFACRTPDGYPDEHQKWATTNSITERWRVMEQILLGQIPGIQVTIPEPSDNANRWVEEFTLSLGCPISVHTSICASQFYSKIIKRPRRHLFTAGLVFMSPDFLWT